MEALKAMREALLDWLRPRRKLLASFRSQWAAPGNKDEPRAGRWFRLTRADTLVVDDKTWADLEFPRIFRELDTTTTPLGSQVLHGQLRQCLDDAAVLAERHALHVRLRDDAALRERLQMILVVMQDRQYADVADAVFGDGIESSSQRTVLMAGAGAALLALVGVACSLLSAWVFVAVLAVNVLVVYRNSAKVLRQAEALGCCVVMLQVARKLSGCGFDNPLITQIRAQQPARDTVQRGLRLLFAYRRCPPWLAIFLNFVFLLELILHALSIAHFQRTRQQLHRTFELVGGLDAAIAAASAMAMFPRHCQPQLSDAPHLEMVDGMHPLLPRGVTNSIRLQRRSALVMGSNMAGKTTFVKMLAVNAILGRTLGFCLASRAVLPRAQVMASIHGRHSVESGKSHYFAEVEAIRGFLASEQTANGHLFVLDEPFSGTNTQERIAIAFAVLRALCRQSIVLVTTHDVELQALLEEHYELFHFQEDPAVDGFFDYQLRAGPARRKNAIRILARMGFPDDVVEAALATSATLQ